MKSLQQLQYEYIDEKEVKSVRLNKRQNLRPLTKPPKPMSTKLQKPPLRPKVKAIN